uniref:Uncharacterized protein n=1 Tax=Rhizophora mucronata TaxID=61149 RepID=A0A2P2PIK0_RHIMU
MTNFRKVPHYLLFLVSYWHCYNYWLLLVNNGVSMGFYPL